MKERKKAGEKERRKEGMKISMKAGEKGDRLEYIHQQGQRDRQNDGKGLTTTKRQTEYD